MALSGTPDGPIGRRPLRARARVYRALRRYPYNVQTPKKALGKAYPEDPSGMRTAEQSVPPCASQRVLGSIPCTSHEQSELPSSAYNPSTPCIAGGAPTHDVLATQTHSAVLALPSCGQPASIPTERRRSTQRVSRVHSIAQRYVLHSMTWSLPPVCYALRAVSLGSGRCVIQHTYG